MALTARKLISYESTRFWRMTSPCRFREFLWEGLKYSKSSAITVADWMFTRLGYMLVSVSPTKTAWHPTRKLVFLRSPKDSGNLQTGLPHIPAQRYVWNQPESITFRITSIPCRTGIALSGSTTTIFSYTTIGFLTCNKCRRKQRFAFALSINQLQNFSSCVSYYLV